MTTPTTPTDAMVEALKPCPFCGEKPVLMRRTWHHNHKIECLNENCSTDRLIIFGNTMEEAVTRWNTRTAALQHQEPGGTEPNWADFGEIREEVDGVVMVCNATVPGMTLHDLVCIFDEAQKATDTDAMSGNPGTWPVVRGVSAVVSAVVESLRPLRPTPPAPSALDRAVEALETAESWIDRHAPHVGNCGGGNACSCGRTLVLAEINAAALEAILDNGGGT